MDSIDVIRVCIRRWYVVLPVLLLSAGAALGMANQVKPTFAGVGSYAFVYPHSDLIRPNAADPRDANPIGGRNPTLLGEAVVADLMSTSTQDRIGRSNTGTDPSGSNAAVGIISGAHYTVSLPNNSALYLVQTWSESPKDAAEVVNAVLAASSQVANKIQERAGAPAVSRYNTFVTSPTQTTELPKKSPLKTLIGVMGAGVIVGSILAMVMDRAVARRTAKVHRQRRRLNGGRGRARAEDRSFRSPPEHASAAVPAHLGEDRPIKVESKTPNGVVVAAIDDDAEPPYVGARLASPGGRGRHS